MPRKHDRPATDREPAQPKPKRQRLTDSQLERKRELDREAQRTIRERTKNHIAHLEALVEQLQGERGGQVERLVAQLNDSRAEINKLRDALGSIIKISTSVTGVPNPTAGSTTKLDYVKNESSPQDSTHDPSIHQHCSNDDSESMPTSRGQVDTYLRRQQHVQTDGQHLQEQTDHELPVNPVDLESYSPFEAKFSTRQVATHQPDDDEPDEAASIEGINNKQVSISQIATSIVGDKKLEGRYWYLAGVILSHIIKTHRRDPSPMSFVHDEDIAIRAIFDGWSAVMARYPLDRGWQWLKEIDEKLYFNHFGPAERLMHLRNSRFQLLHQLYPDAGWNSNLPAFYSARPSQRYLEHDPLIEHFPWPSFRERLLFSPRKFATNKFMDALKRNFHLVWSYDFDNLYHKDALTGAYLYSDLFTKHIMDMKCYTVRYDFFDKFPELKQDIPWINPTPLSLISHRFSISSGDQASTRRPSVRSVPGEEDQVDDLDSGYSGSHAWELGCSLPTSPADLGKPQLMSSTLEAG